MVTHPRQIFDPTTPNQHHRVLLEVVSYTWDIGGHFYSIG
jgi:hypothetical protein